MTRGQRAAHRWIWLIAMPIAGLLVLGVFLARPDPAPPAQPAGAGAAP